MRENTFWIDTLKEKKEIEYIDKNGNVKIIKYNDSLRKKNEKIVKEMIRQCKH